MILLVTYFYQLNDDELKRKGDQILLALIEGGILARLNEKYLWIVARPEREHSR